MLRGEINDNPDHKGDREPRDQSSRTDVLATRHAREAELRAEDALEAGRALKDKHGGKPLECFDDPECAFVKARLFR